MHSAEVGRDDSATENSALLDRRWGKGVQPRFLAMPSDGVLAWREHRAGHALGERRRGRVRLPSARHDLQA
jgi:hypothetical protein